MRAESPSGVIPGFIPGIQADSAFASALSGSRGQAPGRRLSLAYCGALVVASVLTVGAFTQEVRAEEGIAKPVEECIRKNAADVEKAITSLTEGTEFLIGRLCAEPLAVSRKNDLTDRRRRDLERVNKQCAEKKVKTEVDTKTLSGDSAPCEAALYVADQIASESDRTIWVAYSGRIAEEAPPSAIGLAARLLLDLRLARLKSPSSKEPN